MMETIYARPRCPVADNGSGGFLCQAVLFTDYVPDSFPTSGSGIVGMDKNDTFAAGTCLICVKDKKVFLVGKDNGSFTLWKEG